jgi:hypothetical protein
MTDFCGVFRRLNGTPARLAHALVLNRAASLRASFETSSLRTATMDGCHVAGEAATLNQSFHRDGAKLAKHFDPTLWGITGLEDGSVHRNAHTTIEDARLAPVAKARQTPSKLAWTPKLQLGSPPS